MKDSRLNKILNRMADAKEVVVTESYWTAR